MTTGHIILAAHAASTLAMTGLIWFVQIVHYPLFAAVEIQMVPTSAAPTMKAGSRAGSGQANTRMIAVTSSTLITGPTTHVVRAAWRSARGDGPTGR